MPLQGGLPVIAVHDLAIQRRENDLVCATFGRGFYVLDDYTPLRHLSGETLARAGTLFPVRKACRFEERPRDPETGFATSNPPFGAVFTYYLKAPATPGVKMLLTVTGKEGKTLRELSGPTSAGVHRVSWDLNAPDLIGSGKYRVALAQVVDGVRTAVGEAQEFEVVSQ
jgi:hypothetical protein